MVPALSQSHRQFKRSLMNDVVHQEVSRRNAQSVMASLQDCQLLIREQQKRIDSLVNALSSISERLIALENSNALLKVMSIGHGATAR